MKKIIILIMFVPIMFGAVFGAVEEHNFTKAIEIVNSKTNCEDLTLNQLEMIGDYFMELNHPGEVHELMDEMMGGEGSESLREAHINMANRFYCSQFVGYTNTNYNSGMMGGGMMYNDNYNTNYGGNNMMSGYLNPFGYGLFGIGMGFMMIIFWGLVIWLIYFLIKSSSNNNNNNNSNNKIGDKDPLHIAKHRFARGEITKKEFEEIKKELK